MIYRCLEAFEEIFHDGPYRHRLSTHGDRASMELFEDLYAIKSSAKFNSRVDDAKSVLNTKNQRQGVKARRGDGMFGTALPHESAINDDDFRIARGRIAQVEIGVEVKILAKAMGKQIERVVTDLARQAEQFKAMSANCITVGMVAVNHADHAVSWEGDRSYPTDGGAGFRHPAQEWEAVTTRLEQEARPKFDELLILPFLATNEPPYDFEWVTPSLTRDNYGAMLVRLASLYEARN